MTIDDLNTRGQLRLIGWLKGALEATPSKPVSEVIADFLAQIEATDPACVQ